MWGTPQCYAFLQSAILILTLRTNFWGGWIWPTFTEDKKVQVRFSDLPKVTQCQARIWTQTQWFDSKSGALLKAKDKSDSFWQPNLTFPLNVASETLSVSGIVSNSWLDKGVGREG